MNKQTRALLLAGICTTAGCAARRPVPVRGHTATLVATSGVPGQPNQFRARVRIQRTDGKPMTETLPQLSFDAATIQSFPGIRYSTKSSRPANRKFVEVTIQGSVGQQVAGPTGLGLELVEVRLTPLWKRFVSQGNLEPYHEVIARSPVGRFMLPASPPAGRSTPQK